MSGNNNEYGSGNGSSKGGQFGNTSNFSTTGLSDDGRFLGIKLSPDMAEKMRSFYPIALSWLRRKGEQIAMPLSEKFAKEVLKKGPEEAAHLSGKVGNVVGYSIILSSQLYDLGNNVYTSTKLLNELRSAVAPLHKTTPNASPLSGNNEVIANTRGKIGSIFWQKLVLTGTSLIGAAPALIEKFGEQGIKTQQRLDAMEYEQAKKDPAKLKEYLAKKAGVATVKDGKLPDTVVEAQARASIIEDQRKDYLAKFTSFEKANAIDVRKEVNAALRLTESNVHSSIPELKRLGINTERLETALKNPKADAKTSIANFLKTIDTDKEIERAMKIKYVRQHGAFDQEWTHFLTGEASTEPTLRKQLEQKFAKLDEATALAEKEKKALLQAEKNDKTNEIGTMAAGLGAGLAAELVGKALGSDAADKFSQPIAFDRILHLRRVLEKAGSEAPEQIAGISLGKGKNSEKDMGYVQYVHSIFQQHQRDCNRPEIGERFFEHFEKAHFNDAAIQKMSDDELTPYELALKTIAKRLKTGRMDAIALVTLVGDPQKKLVREEGRAFGPAGAGKDDAAVKEALVKTIDEQTAMLHGQQNDKDHINEKLGNFVFSTDDLKNALSSDEMDPQQRAFIFSVFSDAVGSDKKLCSMLGINETRCQELNQQVKDQFNPLMDGVVVALADMIEQEPEKLATQLKMTDKEKDFILRIARAVRDEGKSAADMVESREELTSLETVAANATMTVKENFWQKVVGASKRLKEPKAEKPSAEEGQHHHGHKHADGAEGEERPHRHTERIEREEPRGVSHAERFREEGGEEKEPISKRFKRDEEAMPHAAVIERKRHGKHGHGHDDAPEGVSPYRG
ncbi:MAG: hypothetical protein SFT92_02235 [Rickettsiales bacterium]|nr:hypothetical protein [Rickettsiales bacterium]